MQNSNQNQKPERDPSLKASVKITSRIDKVADPTSSRYALSHVQATPRNEDEVFLTATNGRSLVIVPAEGYVDQERLIPNSVLLKKKPSKKPHVASLNGHWQSTEGRFAEEPEGRFPRCEEVLTDLNYLPEDIGDLNKDWAGHSFQVTLDPHLLLAMAEALNQTDQAVTLFFRADKGGLVNDGISVLGEKGIGMLMPCRADKRAHERYEAMAKEYKKAKQDLKNGAAAESGPATEEAQPAEEPAQAA